MASTALNSRILEAMVTSRPEKVNSSSPIGGQDVPATYIAQYTATLEDFARRNGAIIDETNSPPSGADTTEEDDEGSYDEANGGQKRSASSPFDSAAKKRRKQSKPNKIEGSDCSGEGEEMDKEDRLERGSESSLERLVDESMRMNISRLASSPVRCPYCDISTASPNELRQHMSEQHFNRMINEEDIIMHQAQITRQKLIEQQDHQRQLQYQQKIMHDALRFQEQISREREVLMEQERKQHQHQQSENKNYHDHQQRDVNISKSSPKNEQNQKDREEHEAGPLNLSNSRWENHSVHSQEPQRSPVTPLPASIPMPPSFTDGRFNFPGLSPFAPPHFLLPFMQQNGREPGLANSPQNNFGSGGSRIFNLEAFCELCNKEFCNKYFLKTHKANKHGIFTDEPGCSPMPPTPPTPLGPSTPIGSSAPMINPLLHSPMTPTSMGNSPYAGAFLAANLGNLPLRPPLPVSIHSNSKTFSGQSKNDSTNQAKSGIINLDAYCELCQKEFCNKYFLKRHKLKIHNVNIEVTIKTPKNSSALDRPEGWCDACRRDIGSRASLNVHKLNVHGPHIINNITSSASDISPRSALDMKHMNPLSMKLNNGEHNQKQNFSPWDSIREKEAMDHSFGNKLFGPKRSNQENEITMNLNGRNKPENEDKNDHNHHMFMNNKNLPPAFSLAGAMTSDSMYMPQQKPDKHDSIKFEQLHKIKLTEQNGSPPNSGSSEVKLENKSSTDLIDTIPKSLSSSEIEHQMPILKPQIESHSDLITPKNSQVEEDRPPLLTKEQMALHSKMEFDDSHENAMNSSDPPRTPGGVSNSTDDSSREAGFIARVGQPAIVQAPPGTKFTNEQLQKLGVVNPDAFCELCCKEFCNKYFLRTHRIKRHNIYTPEYSERSKQHYKEANPINLAKIFEKQAIELRQSNAGAAEFKFDCDICRKPFPNSYLMHMHKYCFHGLGQDSVMSENLPLPQHMIQQEQLRQLALQAQHQKMQDQQEFLLHRQKDFENDEELHHQQRTLQLFQDQQHRQKSIAVDEVNNKLEEEKNRCSIEKQIQQRHEEIQSQITCTPKDNDSRREIEDNCNINNEEVVHMKSPRMSPSVIENNNMSNNETDTSQELRKLQSMIFELNRSQDSDGVICKICQKDIGNKYFLRAHMMTEHGLLLQDEIGSSENGQHNYRGSMDNLDRIPSPISGPNSDNQAYCDICKKDFFSRFILQQHMISSHGTFVSQPGSTSFLDRIRAEVEGRDEKKPNSVSRSFCDICQKELCNKYFMKTHMMRMHKINIENDNSGGVTCDICNKELCSKYFLKVHRQNSHGTVEDNRDPKEAKDGALPKRRDSEEIIEDLTTIEICPLCQRKFRNAKWLRTHLTQDHGEEGKIKWQEIEPNYPSIEVSIKNNLSCTLCGQMQPDIVTLQVHLIKYHNSAPNNELENNDSDEKALQCSSCSFVCRSSTLLEAHERIHSPSMPSNPFQISSQLQCHICSQVMPNLESFQQHLVSHHLQGIFEPLLKNESKSPDDNNEEALSNMFETLHKVHIPSKKRSKKRWRCKKCQIRYKSRSECLFHIFSKHSKKSQPKLYSYQPGRQKTYRCRNCGIYRRKLGDLIQHMQIHYPKAKSKSDKPIQCINGEPMAEIPGQQYIMQRFLMNRENEAKPASSEGEEEGEEFFPSLVTLPVNRTVLRSLKVSFNLTPAQ